LPLSTEILYDVDAKDWNKLISRNSASTGHQIANLYKPLEMAFNSKQVYIYVKNSNGDIVGQLTAVIHSEDFSSESNFLSSRMVSKLNLGNMLFWNHGPIIHDNSNKSKILFEILNSLETICKEKKIILIKGRSCPLAESNPNEIFEKFGYTCNPWLAYISNIDSIPDKFFSSLHNKIRYDIRKGEKNQFEFEVITNRKSLDEFAELKLEDQKNKNELIKRNAIFRDYQWETSIKNGLEKFFIARLNGEVVGGIANLLFNNNVVQHTVVNSTNQKINAGSFLTWNTIKWSIENKFLTYDMGGANPSPISKKEKGIKHFKSKWNGKEVQYTLYTKIVNKTRFKISKGLRQPNLVLKKIFNAE